MPTLLRRRIGKKRIFVNDGINERIEVRRIPNKNEPIRQHHVPKVYLKNFCDQYDYITVMNKQHNRIFTTGINAIGVEKDFYTLEKLNDPYYWEHAYTACIEPLMGKPLKKLISHAIWVRSGTTILSPTEKAQLFKCS